MRLRRDLTAVAVAVILLAGRAGGAATPNALGRESSASSVQRSQTAQETVLYNFGSAPDGAVPNSTLVADGNGNLYGTTLGGGQFGDGTVFKLTPTGLGSYAESVLHSFQRPIDGV